MEASLALDLIMDMFNKMNGKVYIEKLVSDDNSTMRSLLQQKTVHDKGQLLEATPQPFFVCDLSQRIKVMSKPVFKMVRKSYKI